MAIKKESKVTAPNDDTKNAPTPTVAPPAPPVEAPKEEKKALLSVQDVTKEVLAGRWGVSFAAAQQKLDEAGYDTEAVWAEYQRRKAGGAPTAF